LCVRHEVDCVLRGKQGHSASNLIEWDMVDDYLAKLASWT
jgi:hypothetical protein